MKRKIVSTNLSKTQHKNLSKWDEAIQEAKKRITQLRRSIRYFEGMRDNGMEFPEPEGQEKTLKG